MQKNKKLQRKCVDFLTDLQKEERKKRRDQRGTIHMNIHTYKYNGITEVFIR